MIPTKKTSSFYDCENSKASCHVLNVFKDQKPTFMLFGGDAAHCPARKVSRDYEKKNHLHFWEKLFANRIQAHPNLSQKKWKETFHLWHNRVDSTLVDTVNQKFIYIVILYTFSLQ